MGYDILSVAKYIINATERNIMNRYLLLFLAVFLLMLSWFIRFRHYLRVWIAQFRSQSSVTKRRRKSKSLPCLFPTKRPDCPLCQAEENLPPAMTPEPPLLIVHKRGRPRSIDTDMHFCPNNDCEYYGWLARGNICTENSGMWLQANNDRYSTHIHL